MNNFFSILILLILQGCTVNAQEQFKGRLSLNLTIDSDTVNFIEPVFYKIAISNQTQDSLIISEPWSDYSKPLISISMDSTNVWDELIGSNFGPASFRLLSQHGNKYMRNIYLYPEQELAETFCWVPFYQFEQYLKLFNKKC